MTAEYASDHLVLGKFTYTAHKQYYYEKTTIE